MLKLLALSCLCHLSHGFASQNPASQTSPIEVKSIDVSPSTTGCTNVTLTFTAMSLVQVVWTVDNGIKPEDLSPNTIANNHLITNGDSHASICLPSDLVFEKLILHLLCKMHSFELHLDMRLPKSAFAIIEPVRQYDLLVPTASEIGVTSRGEARFPVMVNTSGTAYTFGLLHAEVTLLYGKYVKHESAFSFLPVDDKSTINVHKIATNGNENHFNVAIKSHILPKSESLIVVMAACSNPNSIVERIDVKQEVLIQMKRGVISGFASLLNFVDGQQDTVKVEKHKHATLVCKTVGISNPKATLYKKTSRGIEPVNLPSYTTSLPFETTTVFQLINATDSDAGVYICKVSKGDVSASKVFTVDVVA